MKLIINYLLCVFSCLSFSVLAMDDQSQGAKVKSNWVFGSNRAGHTLGKYINLIADNANSRTDHIEAYDNGMPTFTMDINPCKLPGVNHKVADAMNFDFSPYSIYNVYFERFPTFNESKEFAHEFTSSYSQLPPDQQLEKFLSLGNMIGKVLDNVIAHMEEGALVEIEWHPYNLFLPTLTDKQLEVYQKANPFTGYFNRPYFEKIVENGHDDEVKAFLSFYQHHGLGLSDEQIRQELHDNIIVFKENGATSINSLLFLLQVDLAVKKNAESAINFLRERGFADVSLTRMTSKRNLRKNVWILQGIKKKSSGF